jgi:AAA+ superfamily predicted ATPase
MLCKYLNIFQVVPPLAAGDFNKGIVGDAERMLNEIAERAKLIPWEMCVVMIDEIDSLAPNRKLSNNIGNKEGG